MNTDDDLCVHCNHRAVRDNQWGEPVCYDHWKADGMYDPDQGYEPTEADYNRFAASRP